MPQSYGYLRRDLIWLIFIQGYLAVEIIIGFKAWTNKYNRSKGLYKELYTLDVYILLMKPQYTQR